MIRVNVVAERQSEMKFVKDPLNRYFGGLPLMDSRPVLTSRNSKTNYEYRGGLLEYRHAKGETVSELLNFIGIPAIRKKCPHFSEWIEKLQNLPEL